MIQKNLLAAFPEQAAAIDTFFNGGLRQVSIRATTSCVFRYAPPTRPLNLFLLAEEDRKKILAMEATARLATARLVQQQINLRRNLAAAGDTSPDDQPAALSNALAEGGSVHASDENLGIDLVGDWLVMGDASVQTSAATGTTATNGLWKGLAGERLQWSQQAGGFAYSPVPKDGKKI